MVGCLKRGDLEIGMLDLPEGLGHRIRLLTTSRILLYFFCCCYGTNFSLRAFQNVGFDTQKPRFWNIKALFTVTVVTVVSGNHFRTLFCDSTAILSFSVSVVTIFP